MLVAWFPTAQEAPYTLTVRLPWLLRTSPPMDGEGLIEAIANARGVLPRHILPEAGSSCVVPPAHYRSG